ncbi:MAG: BlaI/MecI/CopY family transcriptional regulator, partial [Gemmatimonas sp.]
VSAPAISQALDDVSLPHAARLVMWHLGKRLDVTHFREVKTDSLASEMRLKPNTVFKSLRQLVARGYLEEHTKRKPRAYRMPWSRIETAERPASAA